MSNKYYDLFNKTLAMLNGNEQDKGTELFDKVYIAQHCDYFFNECGYMDKIKKLTNEQQERVIDIIYSIYENSYYDKTNLYIVSKSICELIEYEYNTFTQFIKAYNKYEEDCEDSDFYEKFDEQYCSNLCD